MKATIDLPESLLAEVREVADRKGWKVKTVFEASLRQFVDREQAVPSKPFKLKRTTVKGESWPDLTFAEMLQMTDPDRLKDFYPDRG